MKCARDRLSIEDPLMGITIHFSGSIDDLQRVEEMEDRVTDLVFALGGKATIWRSYADHDPTRVVRGLLVDMAPGQETLSLLISPEGHLTPLFQIEDAEKQPFHEPPYCSVKTQFGSIQGHVAVVLLLDALKQRYFSTMEITDESGYAENRNIADLKHKQEFLAGAIRALADGINAHQLSPEAAEDPNIVASRIERIARLVQQKMRGESAARNQNTEDPLDVENDFDAPLEDQVAEMDVLRRKNNLRSERMLRRITEATASGQTVEEAFRLAMEEEGLGDFPSSDSDSRSNDDNWDARQEGEPWQDVEPWQESLPSPSFAAADELQQRDTHPAVIQAQEFLMQLMNLDSAHSPHDSFLSVACRGAGDIMGGLAQATGSEFDSRIDRAIAITQLKRALTGHAFAQGAVFGLRSANVINQETSAQLHDQLAALLVTIHELSAAAWDENGFD